MRKMPFEKPDPAVRAVQLNLSGGLAVITFFKTQNARPIHATFLVLDATTGERLGHYEPSEELGNNLLCFSPSDGFTFMRRDKDGKIKLQTALLR